MRQPYEHTQDAPLWLVPTVICAVLFLVATSADDSQLTIAAAGAGVLFLLLAAMFKRLTVRETDEHLAVRYGPLPVFGTKVRYDRVRSVRQARSRLIDGWGVHWLPGRGCTFNLWGWDCVEITTDRGIVRIGSDDAEGLLQHLTERTGRAGQ